MYFTNKLYKRFSPGDIIGKLLEEELTGTSDGLIIAVTELCSLVIFLMINSKLYPNKLLAYTGDNQNVITWLLTRRAGNPLDRFLLRILSRLEHKYCFRVYPLYISSLNNFYCDKPARLLDSEALGISASMNWNYAPADKLIAVFFAFNLPWLALALPCDSDDQTRFILQLTEKRTFRSIPKTLSTQHLILSLGLGTGGTGQALGQLHYLNVTRIPWPSEGPMPVIPTGFKSISLGFSHPPSPSDWVFVYKQIEFYSPIVITFDLHPKHLLTNQKKSQLKLNDFTTWNWDLNCASVGAPQARTRTIWFAVSPEFEPCPNKVPLRLSHFHYPLFLMGLLSRSNFPKLSLA